MAPLGACALWMDERLSMLRQTAGTGMTNPAGDDSMKIGMIGFRGIPHTYGGNEEFARQLAPRLAGPRCDRVLPVQSLQGPNAQLPGSASRVPPDHRAQVWRHVHPRGPGGHRCSYR